MQIGGIRWFFYMHAPNIQRIVRLTCCSKVLKHTCIWLRSCDQLYNANHEHACTYSIKATAEQRVGWHRRWLVRLACCSAVLKKSFIWLRSYDYLCNANYEYACTYYTSATSECVHTCMCVRTQVCAYMCMCACLCEALWVYVRPRVFICVCVCARVCGYIKNDWRKRWPRMADIKGDR